jgi:two-component system nitrate/nitrite response regulator NarL
MALGLGQALSVKHQVEVAGLECLATVTPGLLQTGGTSDAVILDAHPEAAPLIQTIRGQDPSVPLAIWQRGEAIEPALNALALGVQGVLLDTSPPADVLTCLETILQGGTWVPPAIAQAAVFSRQCKLTKREGELMSLIATGLSNKEVAYTLGISVGTVKVYLCRLFDKLGVSDRYGLALLALRQGGSGGKTPGAATPARADCTPQEPYLPRSVFVPRRANEWRDIVHTR